MSGTARTRPAAGTAGERAAAEPRPAAATFETGRRHINELTLAVR
jgi:hypothetical protein